MKIAYVGIKGLPSKAGADRVVEAIVSRLDKETHELTIYCSSRIVAPGTQVPGVRLIRVPVLSGKRLHALSLFLFSALHALFFGDFDLVHLHNAEAGFVLPILRLRFKVVATSHGLTYARDKWNALDKFFIRLADYPFLFCSNRVTSVSMPTARYYQDTYHREVMYVPNGVDIDPKTDVQAARSRLSTLGLSDERYIMFAAGRIGPTKGCHLLLDAWRQVDVDARLLVVGDFEQVPAYSRQLREVADERVVLVPFIASKEELFGIVQGADLFVFPSTYEAMSMMLLEVASLGVPILCSDIPANTSVLAEHTLYFRSGDVQDLACKLRWALENAGQMSQLAARARAWVEERFSWDTIVEQYETLYYEIMIGDSASMRLAHFSPIQLEPASFCEGDQPEVSGTKDQTGYFLFSLDTELAWGYFDFDRLRSKKFSPDGSRERRSIELLLDILDEFGIVGTWAVTGHLFYERCEECDICPILEWKGKYHSFKEIYKTDNPLWYGADVIETLLTRGRQHEIAFHGYTHRVFDENTMSEEAARTEIQEWLRLSKRKGIVPQTVIFPRHEIGYLNAFKENGFICYRGKEYLPKIFRMRYVGKLIKLVDYTLSLATPPVYGLNRVEPCEMMNFPPSQHFFGFPRRFEMVLDSLNLHKLRINRMVKGVKKAADEKRIVHIWAHPWAFQTKKDFGKLRYLFDYVSDEMGKGRIQSIGMADLARKAVEQHGKG